MGQREAIDRAVELLLEAIEEALPEVPISGAEASSYASALYMLDNLVTSRVTRADLKSALAEVSKASSLGTDLLSSIGPLKPKKGN